MDQYWSTLVSMILKYLNIHDDAVGSGPSDAGQPTAGKEVGCKAGPGAHCDNDDVGLDGDSVDNDTDNLEEDAKESTTNENTFIITVNFSSDF